MNIFNKAILLTLFLAIFGFFTEETSLVEAFHAEAPRPPDAPSQPTRNAWRNGDVKNVEDTGGGYDTKVEGKCRGACSGNVKYAKNNRCDNCYDRIEYIDDDDDDDDSNNSKSPSNDAGKWPPTASCRVSPTTVEVGDSVAWTASAAGGTSYKYEWGGNAPNRNSSKVTVSYSKAGKKTAKVKVSSGSLTSGWINCSNSVTVKNPPPVASLEVKDNNANPSWKTGSITIDPIDEVSLAWNRTNGARDTVSCSGQYFATGNSKQGSTSNVVEPTEEQGSRTYRVRCDGVSGTAPAYASVTVNVRAGTGAEISLNKDRVRRDEEVSITWDNGTSRPESCRLLMGNNVVILASLLGASNPISVTVPGETSFTLDCPGGNDATSDTIEILPEFQET